MPAGPDSLKIDLDFATEDNIPNEAHTSDSEATALSLSDCDSIDSDVDDIFQVSTLPESMREWITAEDQDLNRIEALASHVRDKPLLPLSPATHHAPTSLANSGIKLPFAHCVFKDCEWCRAEKPQPNKSTLRFPLHMSVYNVFPQLSSFNTMKTTDM